MRQSLRKRRPRYKKKRQEEFQHWQKLLRRVQCRLVMGVYAEKLKKEEADQIRRLLSQAILDKIKILSMRVGIEKPRPFTVETSRTAYFKICKILRTTGGRKSPTTAAKVIRRTHESPEV